MTTPPGGNHIYFPHDSMCEEHSGRMYSESILVRGSTPLPIRQEKHCLVFLGPCYERIWGALDYIKNLSNLGLYAAYGVPNLVSQCFTVDSVCTALPDHKMAK